MHRDYKLSTRAIKDVAEILSRLHGDVSPAQADKVEGRFFQAFDELANIKALGHTREDITAKNILFYAVKPYVILLRQTPTRARILRVVHGSRDLSKL